MWPYCHPSRTLTRHGTELAVRHKPAVANCKVAYQLCEASSAFRSVAHHQNAAAPQDKKDPKVRLVESAPRAAPPPEPTHRAASRRTQNDDRSARRREPCAAPESRRPRARPHVTRAAQADWPFDEDGQQVHPRSERGLLLKGLLKPLPKKGEVPDCLLVEPFTEEVVPANAAAVLAHLPSAGADAAYCYAKPPGDADVYKLHGADNRAPEACPH